MSDKILRLDEYRPHVVIGCEPSGNQHVFMLAHLQAIADGHAPVSDLPDEVMRSIVAQWIEFIDVIDEFHEAG